MELEGAVLHMCGSVDGDEHVWVELVHIQCRWRTRARTAPAQGRTRIGRLLSAINGYHGRATCV